MVEELCSLIPRHQLFLCLLDPHITTYATVRLLLILIASKITSYSSHLPFLSFLFHVTTVKTIDIVLHLLSPISIPSPTFYQKLSQKMFTTASASISHALASFQICKHDPYYSLHQKQINLIKVSMAYNFRFHKLEFDFSLAKVIL